MNFIYEQFAIVQSSGYVYTICYNFNTIQTIYIIKEQLNNKLKNSKK